MAVDHVTEFPRALLQIQNVSLEYQTRHRIVRATQGVSIDVFEAERHVLLGPSACAAGGGLNRRWPRHRA